MNYDRLLTRVFDKQERVMIYPGDKFNSNHYGNSPYELVGIDSRGLIALDPWKHEINIIPFGDRYVPMMCTGKYDIKGKLIYELDIARYSVKHSKFCGLIKWDEKSVRFRLFILRRDGDSSFSNININECEIIGDRWENEKLLEVKA